MNSVYLYWDSLRRMSYRQSYYWLVNRCIKRAIGWRSIPRWGSVGLDSESAAPAPSLSDVSETARIVLFSRLPVSESHLDDVTPYLQFAVTPLLSAEQVAEGLPLLRKAWLDDCPDEEFHNLHRFHLFCEVVSMRPASEMGVRLIEAWIKLAPLLPRAAHEPFTTAVRLINWVRLLQMAGESPVRETSCSEIVSSMHSQTTYVLRNLEYELGGNHLLVELYAVWLVSSILPGVKGMTKIARFAQSQMEKELAAQFGSVCFHSECSIHYHIQATLVILLWLHGLKALGETVPREMRATAGKAVQHVYDLMLPDGSVPVIGDKSYSLFGKCSADDICLLKTLSNELGISSEVNGPRSDSQIGSNFRIRRQGKHTLIINIGGDGDSGNPGHRHSDLLSFVYCFGGRPMIIDPGTSTYTDDEEALSYKRAAVHNTLSIDGRDQAHLWRFFRWAYLPQGVLYDVDCMNGQFSFTGEYRGFRQIGGISHQRRFVLAGDQLVISDHVDGRGVRDLTFNLTIAPAWTVTRDRGKVRLDCDSGRATIDIGSRQAPNIEISYIMVYPEYNYGLRSQRITMMYPQVRLPFSCEMTIAGTVITPDPPVHER